MRTTRPTPSSRGGSKCLSLVPGFLLSILLATAAPPVSLADADFGAPIAFDAGTYPVLAAIGDPNADGKPDLVVANNYSDDVSVLLGTGNGTFGARSNFMTGGFPSFVAIGDLNGDAKLDLAVTNSTSNTASVLLGNGDGAFGAKTDFETGSAPHSVAIEDLNGDGMADLAVANSNSNTVSVLLGNGDGTFGAKTDYATGIAPLSVAIGYLNGDGKPDLAVTNAYSNTLSVFLGNGDGTFGAKTDFATGDYPASVAVGDLNSDGNLDVVTANGGLNRGGPGVSVLLGNGDGTFGTNTDLSAGRFPNSVAIGDLDGDEKPDLTVANIDPNTVSVMVGNGDGTFGAKTDFAAGDTPYSVAIGDLNGDGKPDLAVANALPNTVSVLLNGAAPLAVAVRLDPETLNLRALSRWVTGYLEPPAPFTPEQIDVGSVRLNGIVPVSPAAPTEIGDHDGNGISDLMVKFDRGAVELALAQGPAVTVTVTGMIDGRSFTGTDVIRVVHAVVSSPATGTMAPAGTTTPVHWETPSGVQAQSVALLSSVDDGAGWVLEARDLPDTGSYEWRVPDVNTDQARVAVVLVEASDLSGYIVDGVLGISGTFSIVHVADVGADAKVEFALRGATPSPAYRELRVTFRLPDAQPATLALFDVSGRLVVTRPVGGLGAGVHIVTLGAQETLPAGVYVVRLTQNERTLTTRAVLTR